MNCEQVLSRLDGYMDAQLASAIYSYFVGVKQQPAKGAGLENVVTVDRLMTAMREMNPGQRAIISLHDIDGYTINEISKILEEPVGALKYRLFSARAYLREKLMEPFDENEREE